MKRYLRLKRNSNEGFATITALLFILSLSLILSALFMLVFSSSKKISAWEKEIAKEKEIDSFIDEFISDVQELKNDIADNEYSENRMKLIEKYKDYSLTLSDVSTGINKSILSKEILRDRNISRIAEKHKSDYGWINPLYAKSEQIKSVLDDWDAKNTDDVFPLFCKMPLYNIFEMSDDFILAILDYFKIPQSSDKLKTLKEAMRNTSFTREKLKKALLLSDTSPVLDFLGIKSVFYKAELKKDDFKIELIIAAVPYRYEKTRDVQEYMLISRKTKRLV